MTTEGLNIEIIKDIELLNKIYNEYDSLQNKNDKAYIEIYDKYNMYFNTIYLQTKLTNIIGIIQKVKLIGKFYKYNHKTNKLLIPIFYNQNNLYSNFEFDIFKKLKINMIKYPNKIIYYDLLYLHTPVYGYYMLDNIQNGHIYMVLHFIHLYNCEINKININEELSDYILRQSKIHNIQTNYFNFNFIEFKTKLQKNQEKDLNILKNNILQLQISNQNILNENNLLKNQVRQNEIEIHYLKSINKEKKVKYNYQEIKNRNKQLNQEFKRIYNLISKNIGFNLISQ